MSATLWDRGKHGWYVRVHHNGKRKTRKAGPPGPEGKARALALIEQLNALDSRKRLWRDGDPDQLLPVSELVYGWHETYGPLRSERTRISTDKPLVERLANYFGDMNIRDLTNGHVRRFASVTIQDRSGWLAGNAISILRRVTNLAVQEKLIKSNPVTEWSSIINDARVATAREADSRDAWGRAEIDTLLHLAKTLEPSIYPALLFALHTGARRGEILALKWSDIDFEVGHVRILRGRKLKGGTKTTKNRKGRFLPLSETLAAALQDHRRTRERLQLAGQPFPEWVFPSPRGHAWQEGNFFRTWNRLRKAALKKKVRPLEFHCTRHTFMRIRRIVRPGSAGRLGLEELR